MFNKNVNTSIVGEYLRCVDYCGKCLISVINTKADLLATTSIASAG